MRTIIYPGTFDPITLGHVDLVKRAARLFDKVVIAIANNTQKMPILTVAQRIEIIKEVFAATSNVEVDAFSGLIVELVRQKNAVALLRGLRGSADFENELQLANMNYVLAPEIETVFLAPIAANTFISSSIVREIIRVGGDISAFVPPAVKIFLAKNRK